MAQDSRTIHIHPTQDPNIIKDQAEPMLNQRIQACRYLNDAFWFSKYQNDRQRRNGMRYRECEIVDPVIIMSSEGIPKPFPLPRFSIRGFWKMKKPKYRDYLLILVYYYGVKKRERRKRRFFGFQDSDDEREEFTEEDIWTGYHEDVAFELGLDYDKIEKYNKSVRLKRSKKSDK